MNSYYQTSDLALTVTLSLFYPLDSIDKTHPMKVVFIFKRDYELDKLVESYWKKELKIEPQTFFYQLKTIKSRLYERT